MIRSDIIVLHQRGANSHYLGVETLCGKHGVSLTYLELDLFRQFAMCMMGKMRVSVPRKNLMGIVSILIGFKRDSMVVLGMAPFYWKIILLPLLRCKRVYLHTSWPFWRGDFVPFKSARFWRSVWDRLVPKYIYGVFCVTSTCRQSLIDRYPQFESKSWVVYHCVEDFWFEDKLRTEVVYQYVYVGRMIKEKGVDEVIRLAQMMPDSKFLLVGTGPEVAEIKASAPANAILVGKLGRAELRRALLSSSVLLLPSKTAFNWVEAFGIVVVEATLAGCNVFATDHSGPAEISTFVSSVYLFSEERFADSVFEFLRSGGAHGAVPDVGAAKMFSADNIANIWELGLSD